MPPSPKTGEGVCGETGYHDGMKRERQGWARRIRRLLPRWGFRRRYTGMMMLSSDGRGVPIRQTKLAPDGVEFCEDVSDARWVEESLSDFGTLRSMLPGGFPAYARIFHPAYLNGDEDQPVRWATVASWTGRAAHPLMQFERIAGLPEDSMYPDRRGASIRRSAPCRRRSAARLSTFCGSSPRLPATAASACGRATGTSTPACTGPPPA